MQLLRLLQQGLQHLQALLLQQQLVSQMQRALQGSYSCRQSPS
jgi:hypothetical protein